MSDKKFLSQLEIPLRWCDIDAYQHVNNAKYFEFMGETRADFLRDFLATFTDCHFVLVDGRCNFKKAFYYPGNVLVKQYLLSVGNSSFELLYIFSPADFPDDVYAEGYAKMVCVNPDLQKATRIPDEVRRILEK